jgi:outer membrane protein assembly factor BamB
MRRIVHLLAVASAVWAVLVPPSSAATSEAQGMTNWPMEHFDAGRSGVNPFEIILNAGNVDQLALDWSQPIGDRHTFAEDSAAAVWGGMVLAGGSDGLSAFDADTGEQLWRRKLSINSTPAVVDGVLYVGGSGRVGGPYRVAALSAATGATLWTFHTAWLIRSSPAVVDGVV